MGISGACRLGSSFAGFLVFGALSFCLSDVVDFPLMFGMRREPLLREQITQIGWSIGRCIGQPDRKLREDRLQPDPRFHLAELGTGDKAEQDRGAVSSVFAADEQAVLPQDRGKFYHSLGQIVVDIEDAVLGIATQCRPLIQGVREGLADRALGKDQDLFFPEPSVEVDQDGRRMLLTSVPE